MDYRSVVNVETGEILFQGPEQNCFDVALAIKKIDSSLNIWVL